MVVVNQVIRLIKDKTYINRVVQKSVQLAIALLIIVISAVFGSCGGYNTHVLAIKNTKFSFEVPKSYELTPDTIMENGVVEGGIALGIPLDSDKLYFDPELSIVAFDSYADVTFYLDDLLDNLSSSSSGNKFELLDRSSIIVSGIDIEQIIISISSLVPYPDPTYPSIDRRLYFNHKQQIWIISLSSSEKLAEQAEDDFDHLIETLKIFE